MTMGQMSGDTEIIFRLSLLCRGIVFFFSIGINEAFLSPQIIPLIQPHTFRVTGKHQNTIFLKESIFVAHH